MSPREITELMAYDWQPIVVRIEDGSFSLSIPQVPDFEMFGDSEQELRSTWREALRSHLMGYLAVGKIVPVPSVKLASDTDETAGEPDGTAEIILNDRLEPVG
jgi:predicted RNase H-like HicB family nuclease